MVIQDADLEYDPRDLPAIIQPILDGIADVIFGSRFIGSTRRVLYFWHMVVNRGLTLVSNMLNDLNLTDIETCYKAFRVEVVKALDIEENRFGVEPELTAKVAKMRLRIYEVPVSYRGRTYEEGRRSAGRTACAPSTASSSTACAARPADASREQPASSRALEIYSRPSVPPQIAALPSSSSMRRRRLYLATRSERASEPVLI